MHLIRPTLSLAALVALGSIEPGLRLQARAAAGTEAHTTVRLQASEIPAQATTYVVLIRGIPCGIQGVWATSENTWRYHFEYNDQGRGPWIDETVVIGKDKIPLSVQVRGHDFFERSVQENYEARLERGGQLRVSTAGVTKTLTAMRILGLPLGAAQLWVDEDTTVFAMNEGSMTLIRRGWEPTLPAIIEGLR